MADTHSDVADSGQGAIPDRPRLSGVYSAREAAAILQVNERTIRRAIARSELLAVKIGRAFQITPASLDSYKDRLRQYAVRHTVPDEPAWGRERSVVHLVDVVRGPAFALPRSLTAFLGREREMRAIAALLTQPEVRLLTLTGPGGAGKTRIALQVAETLALHFVDGVAFVPLAAVADASHIPSAVAQGLGVRELGSYPTNERIASALHGLDALLLLDNFEHVLPAATLVSNLLNSCPRLTILVTSRTPLNLSGEYRFPVPPMELPETSSRVTAEVIGRAEAVRLFVDRAQMTRPSFAVTDENASAVARICHRLDGLPLAIELAAARSNVLPPQMLLSRLDWRLPLLTGGPRDAPQRLQTMRDAIAWSYDLLTADEQTLCRRLAVFMGGCSLEAALAMVDSGDGVASISSLVTSSLLRQDEDAQGQPRYLMLETLREFALERLAEAGEEAAIRHRHATWFLAFAERWSPDPPMPGETQRTRAITHDYDNIRGALDWFAEQGDAEALVRLSGALFEFWFSTSLYEEGRAWVHQALARGASLNPDIQLRAISCGSTLAIVQGDEPVATRLVNAELAIAREIGDPHRLAAALINAGLLAGAKGDHAVAERDMLEVHEIACNFSDPAASAWIAGVALANLGSMAMGRGDLALAADRLEASIALVRPAGHVWVLGGSLLQLGAVRFLKGELATATALIAESLPLSWSVPDQRDVASSIVTAGAIAAERGHPGTGIRLLGAAFATFESLGTTDDLEQRIVDRCQISARASLGERGLADGLAAGRALTLEQAVNEAMALLALLMDQDDVRSAAATRLTARERHVLQLLVAGQTDREIAARLFIGRRTVQDHVSHILAKLGVANRTEAASEAVRTGLV